MSFTPVTVTATYPKQPGGGNASGVVTFQLTDAIQDTASHQTLEPIPLSVGLVNGSLSVVLDANDDASTSPPGTAYIVTEAIQGAPVRTYKVVISHTAPGGTVDLSTLAPATTVANYDYLLASAAQATFVACGVPTGLPLWWYGHSYVQSPGAQCTSTLEQFNRLKALLPGSSSTTYGVGGSKMIEVAIDAIGQGGVGGGAAGSTWPSTRRGVGILDCAFNDAFQPYGVGTAVDGAYEWSYQQALQAFLAVCSCSRVEDSTGTASGAWTSNVALTKASAGALSFTNAQNASISIPVTVPASGVVYALLWAAQGQTAGLTGTVACGGQSVPLPSLNPASIPSGRTGGAANSAIPYVVKVSGCTPGASNLVVTKTDAGSAGVLYVDAALIPLASPTVFLVLKDPSPQAPTSSPNIAAYNANKAILDPLLVSAVAGFANATVVDQAAVVTSKGISSVDGLHPNDRGMRQIAELLREQIVIAAGADQDGLYLML